MSTFFILLLSFLASNDANFRLTDIPCGTDADCSDGSECTFDYCLPEGRCLYVSDPDPHCMTPEPPQGRSTEEDENAENEKEDGEI